MFDTCGLPLFSKQEEETDARGFHQRDQQQAAVLHQLRRGAGLSKLEWERRSADGGRLAPVIEQLRNAHGLTIAGDGSLLAPYFMEDVRQSPRLARITPEMKAAYYQTPHWHAVRAARRRLDGDACVACSAVDGLVCHHLTYRRLFGEELRDLLTLCDPCHGVVHESCRLKFPSGVEIRFAHLIGWKGFEAWLLP